MQHVARVAEEQLVQFGVGDKEVDKQIAVGYFHTNSGHYAEAIILFSGLLKRYPSVVAAYLGRGTALAMSGRLKDAVTDFSHAIGIESKCVEGYRRRGQSLLALGENALALQDFNVCVQINNGDAESRQQRGICLYKMKDFEAAREEFVSGRVVPSFPAHAPRAAPSGFCA